MQEKSTTIKVKPGINAKGFKTAVKGYGEKNVIEELAANSYDADATVVVVLLDTVKNELHIIDDGRGFTRKSMLQAGTLGGGEKSEVEYSYSNRPYLGAYGFGLKATVNISTSMEINSVSGDGRFHLDIDWGLLEEALKSDFAGFDLSVFPGKGRPNTGTHILLKLKNPATEEMLDGFKSVLGNLPESTDFKCYVGLFNQVQKDIEHNFVNYGKLNKIASGLARSGLLKPSESNQTELEQCTKHSGVDKKDKSIKYTIYFAGIRNGKVNPLKTGLRGIYVRVHGRLLKHNFSETDYTYNISKYMKFVSGIRVEMEINWLKDQMSLSRDDIVFSNSKIKDEFKSALSHAITGFIQPQLKRLELKSNKALIKEQDQRLELAKKRAESRGSIIKTLKSGFNFTPEAESEVALLIANPEVIKRINPCYKLIDYNDKASYDCVIFDSGKSTYLYVELEPTLMEFLNHKNIPQCLTHVITWSAGKWRHGSRKKGVLGYYLLTKQSGAKDGHYKVAIYASEKRKIPKFIFDVIFLDEILRV